MKDEEYRALPYVSQSTLKCFIKSKLEYHYKYVLKEFGGFSTGNLALGSLIHCMILEPAELDKRYSQFDEASRPEPLKAMHSIANKAWKQNQLELAATHGITLVSPDMWAVADTMLQVVCNHQLASSYLFPDTDEWIVHKELDILWQNEVSELPLKSKLDEVLLKVEGTTGTCIVVDYKSTSAYSLVDFGYSIRKYGYDVQDAFYEDAVRYWLQEHYPGVDFSIQVLFIPQKSSPPYQVLGVVELDKATISKAKTTYENALRELEGCLHTGIWEEETGVQLLDLSKGVSLPTMENEDNLPWL